MKISSISYYKAIHSINQYTFDKFPIILLCGKSNVGKSSILGNLAETKKIVKVSSTPGKTQMFQFFLVNKNLYFVDSPGYGYAKVPQSVKQSWTKNMEDFLNKADNIKLVIWIVDIRHPLTELDKKHRKLLDNSSVPYIVLANKSDKLSKIKINQQLDLLEKKDSILSTPYTIKNYSYRQIVLDAIQQTLKQ